MASALRPLNADPVFFMTTCWSSLACRFLTFLLRDQSNSTDTTPATAPRRLFCGKQGCWDLSLKILLLDLFQLCVSMVFLCYWKTKHRSFPQLSSADGSVFLPKEKESSGTHICLFLVFLRIPDLHIFVGLFGFVCFSFFFPLLQHNYLLFFTPQFFNHILVPPQPQVSSYFHLTFLSSGAPLLSSVFHSSPEFSIVADHSFSWFLCY